MKPHKWNSFPLPSLLGNGSERERIGMAMKTDMMALSAVLEEILIISSMYDMKPASAIIKSLMIIIVLSESVTK